MFRVWLSAMRQIGRLGAVVLLLVAAACSNKKSDLASTPDKPNRSGGKPLAKAEILGTAIPHHQEGIQAMALSADGERVYAISGGWPSEKVADPGVHVWQLSDGAHIQTIGDQTSMAVSLDHSGKRLLTADIDGAIRIYDIASGNKIREIPVGENLVWAAFAANEQIITGERPGVVTARPLGKGEAAQLTEVEGLQRVAVSRDGTLVATGDEGGTVRLISLTGGEERTIDAGAEVTALAFSQSGKRLAVGVMGEARLYELPSLQLLGSAAFSSGWPVIAVEVLPDDNRVAVGVTSQGREVELWNVADDARAAASGMNAGPEVILALPGGERFVTGDRRGDIRVWSAEVHKESAWSSVIREVRAGHSHTGRVRHLGVGKDGAVYSWDRGAGGLIWRGDKASPMAIEGQVIAVSPAGDRLALLRAPDEMTSLVDFYELGATEPTKIATVQVPRWLRRAVFSPDGSMLAGTDDDGGIVLIDSHSPDRVVPLATASGIGQALAFDRQGKRIAVGISGGLVTIWPVDGSEPRTLAPAGGEREFLNFNALAFVGDDQLVVASQSHGLQLYDIASGKAATWDEGDGNRAQGTADVVVAGDATRDGTLFAAGHLRGRVTLWSVPDGKLIAEAREHPDIITAIDIAPDGGTVVTADAQGVMRRWPTGR